MKLDRKTLELAYTSFNRPLLEYANVVWDNTKENDRTLDIVEKVNATYADWYVGLQPSATQPIYTRKITWKD